MFNYIYAVGIILFSLNYLSEKKPLVLKENCSLVDSTDFKNRKTHNFTITANYFSIGKAPTSYSDLKKLKKKYGIKIRSAIEFQPLGCTDTLYIPIRYKSFNFHDIQEGTTVKLHCTAYNFYGEDGQLFFYIRKVEVVR